MEITVKCPNCDREVVVSDKLAGSTVECPSCTGQMIQVPTVSEQWAANRRHETSVETQRVVVTDIDIPLLSVMGLMLKFWLASLLWLGLLALVVWIVCGIFGIRP